MLSRNALREVLNLTSVRDGKDVKKPLRLQRYNKKLTYANNCKEKYNFSS